MPSQATGSAISAPICPRVPARLHLGSKALGLGGLGRVWAVEGFSVQLQNKVQGLRALGFSGSGARGFRVRGVRLRALGFLGFGLWHLQRL